MSGGVDSSVTAALLKEAGHEVIGITLRLHDGAETTARTKTCCAGRDVYDARCVAEALDIPHYVFDYADRFRRDVMEPFADAYVAGETPVPCVLCNRTVKFRDLLEAARDLGAAALATGHYVRRVAGPAGVELHRGADPARDQSYFLFATTRAELDFLRFPVGGLAKDEVRAHARRFALPVAAKPDSQDICFVPDGDYAALVARLRPSAAAPGEIVHVDGRVLGRHAGIIHYTVGQRRGLGIAADEALYVVRLEPAARRVVVGPRAALARTRIALRDVNWLGVADGPPAAGADVAVRIRSTQAAVEARIRPTRGGGAIAELAVPETAVAPGQACVFYDGDRVLGGGWIARSDTAAIQFDRDGS
ncbi:MAG: tRNA 2-thiouridine(34) synthase MnmA [Alphaproteobacteria bacterium]|nr:tRNA 2-thiouridine(34) synthase MnmA [Alphaproteobacteria bacterium]